MSLFVAWRTERNDSKPMLTLITFMMIFIRRLLTVRTMQCGNVRKSTVTNSTTNHRPCYFLGAVFYITLFFARNSFGLLTIFAHLFKTFGSRLFAATRIQFALVKIRRLPTLTHVIACIGVSAISAFIFVSARLCAILVKLVEWLDGFTGRATFIFHKNTPFGLAVCPDKTSDHYPPGVRKDKKKSADGSVSMSCQDAFSITRPVNNLSIQNATG